jgi:hypothetical protein
MGENFGDQVKKNVKEVRADVKELLEDYAKRVVQVASDSDVAVEFNDIKFTVPKGNHDSSEIVATWEKLSNEYENLPESKAAAEADAKNIDEKQEQINELTKQLDTLDFSDVKKVLEWCVAFEGPSDRIGTRKDKNKILAKFAEYGYIPDMNIETDYKPDDKENSAKYIIGQALGGIEKYGYVDLAIHGSLDRWNARFNS